ncbi:MAG TPA: hypothetical protein VHC69_26330 [Polyangiaceae bacterium]|nr:hypothetical protein [Polyangiaceae bacterium]
MTLRPAWVAVAMAGLAAVACSKKEDVVVAAADQVHVTDADIDRDPVALLPGAAIGVVHVDAPAYFGSGFGQQVQQLAQARLPLPPSANFVPQRDLSGLYVGLYSMEGANVAGVATGTFDTAAIERAADGTTMTPLGAPLVKTTYARRTLYVSRNVGFAVLTAHTALFGDETGIRRALDRLSEGRAKHETAAWVDQLLATPNAATAGAFDFTQGAQIGAVVKNFPFMQNVQTAKIVGNFQPPGMNFAGTLSYPDPATAQNACQSIQQMSSTVQNYSFFLQLAGIGNPIQKLDTQPNGNDAQFVLGVDSRTVQWLLNLLAAQLGATSASTATPIMIQGRQ